ncbi:MAG TPA: hypothetical protein ENN41_11040 [Sediminispirochaeta sp.]|nr:hypothetical protein [Sediminispirochaeta sp.]
MRLHFILNGRYVDVTTQPSTRLVDLLHDQLDIESLHPACYGGECGNCAIIFNGDLVYSCLIPAFAAQDASIYTYEGIVKSAGYADIQRGFQEENSFPCRYCLASKVVITQSILENNQDPDRQEIMEVLSGTYCSCTNLNKMTKGIIKAAYHRRRSSYGRK